MNADSITGWHENQIVMMMIWFKVYPWVMVVSWIIVNSIYSARIDLICYTHDFWTPAVSAGWDKEQITLTPAWLTDWFLTLLNLHSDHQLTWCNQILFHEPFSLCHSAKSVHTSSPVKYTDFYLWSSPFDPFLTIHWIHFIFTDTYQIWWLVYHHPSDYDWCKWSIGAGSLSSDKCSNICWNEFKRWQ